MEREYAQYITRMQPLNEKLAELAKERLKTDSDLSQEEAGLDTLRGTMQGVDRRLAEAQRDVGLHMEKIHRVEEKNLVAAERTRALQENIARLEAETADLGREQFGLEERTVVLGRRLEEFRLQEVRTEEDLSRKQADLRAVGLLLDSKKMELHSLNEKTIRFVNEIAEGQTDQDRKRGRAENLRDRMAHAAEENSAYEQETTRLEGEIAVLTAEDRQLRRSYTEAEMKFYGAETTKQELKAKMEHLLRTEVELESEVQRLTSRMEFLQGLVETREGLSEGVRFLSTSGRWKPNKNLTVADAVHADEQYRAAIEAALGEFAGLVVVDSSSEAELGMQLLRKEQRGKATFACLDRMPRIHAKAVIPAIPGIHGWAVDFARYQSEYAPLFRFFLDRVLIVEDAETARRVSAAVTGVRCVTLEGEIVTGVGITRGGSRHQGEGGTIGKQKQIDELTLQVAAAEARLREAALAGEVVSREHNAINLKPLNEAVKNIEREMNGVEMRMAQLEFEKKRAADIISKNNEEIGLLADEARSLENEIGAQAPALEVLRSDKGDVERRVGGVTLEIQSLEEKWNDHSRVVNDLGIALVTVRGEIQNAINDLRRAEETIADTTQSLDKHTLDIESARQEIESTGILVAENHRSLDALRLELGALDSHRTGVEEESARIREEIHRVEMRIKDRRRAHDDSLHMLHENELKIADLAAKAEHITARGLEEFEHAIAFKTYPENEFVDFAALRDEIQSLREKLKTLGNINFAAFEEYNTEKARLEFMTTQRKDLLEAEKTLLATIEEINSTAQKKFLDTFAQIRSNFVETFKSLFDPGDECDLKLEEEVDPLEARIEIVAKPRGKRPTSIDLLSGGEKTLTATALLFAIYLVKPSPFCILDEVDAPLDDANVDRFTRILHKFSDNTQFIVVTHNKRTMEAANALYGVTMEEEGVSKLVTVRFNQSAQVTSAAVLSA